MPLSIQRVVSAPYEQNCWIVTSGKETIIIDPGSNVAGILASVNNLQVTRILLTHSHYDHLLGLAEIVKATGAPVTVHIREAAILERGETNPPSSSARLEPIKISEQLTGGKEFSFGDVQIKVLATPGHTHGSVCFLIQEDGEPTPHLFSGDTLFQENVGRTDLPTGNVEELKTSLQTLLTLPGNTVIYPGHGKTWTIREAQKSNILNLIS